MSGFRAPRIGQGKAQSTGKTTALAAAKTLAWLTGTPFTRTAPKAGASGDAQRPIWGAPLGQGRFLAG